MSRTYDYRRKPDESDQTAIDELPNARLLLVQTPGPTSFVVKAADGDKKFKISIGDVQKCSCRPAGQGLCAHIKFVMLKVLRVPEDNALSWQWSLSDSEVETVLQMRFNSRPKSRKVRNTAVAADSGPAPDRREVEEGDICPICQEAMQNTESLTYCRDGCRQSIHAKCMSTWVDHQKNQAEIKCPFCRCTWSQAALDALTKQMLDGRKATSVACCSCHVFPIPSTQYRCLKCRDYNLCEECYDKNFHKHHPLVYKAGPGNGKTGRWKPAPRAAASTAAAHPQEALMRQLEGRELSVEDYDTLLQLDAPTEKPDLPLAPYLLDNLDKPTKQQLQEQMCGACGMPPGELERQTRIAPCGHWFHCSCLKHSFGELCFRCPIDHKSMFIGLALFKKKAKPRADGADGEGCPAEESVVEGGMLQLCGMGIQGASTGMIALPEGITTKKRSAVSAKGSTRGATGGNSTGRPAAANSTASNRRIQRGRAAPRAAAKADREPSAPSVTTVEQTSRERTTGHRFKSTSRNVVPKQRQAENEDVGVDVAGLTVGGSQTQFHSQEEASSVTGGRQVEGMDGRMGSVRGVRRHKTLQTRKGVDKQVKSRRRSVVEADDEVDVSGFSGLAIGGTQLFLPTISSAPCSRDGR